jgi:hypothetical protein
MQHALASIEKFAPRFVKHHTRKIYEGSGDTSPDIIKQGDRLKWDMIAYVQVSKKSPNNLKNLLKIQMKR